MSGRTLERYINSARDQLHETSDPVEIERLKTAALMELVVAISEANSNLSQIYVEMHKTSLLFREIALSFEKKTEQLHENNQYFQRVQRDKLLGTLNSLFTKPRSWWQRLWKK